MTLSRRSFVHSASTLSFAALLSNSRALLGADAPRRKILFFSKSSGFEHEVISYKKGKPSVVEKALTELGAKNNWEFTFSKDGSLFSAEYLKQFDALFFYTTGDLTTPGTDGQPPMSAAGKQAFLDYVASGKGFIGSHSASDTFHTANESKKGVPFLFKFIINFKLKRVRRILIAPLVSPTISVFYVFRQSSSCYPKNGNQLLMVK